MANSGNLLTKLEEAADGLGGQVFEINVKEVIPKHHLRLKCQIPLCRHYGVCKVCPPFIPGVEEFNKVLESYSQAFLVVYRERLTSIDDYRKDFSAELKLLDIVHACETTAFQMGHYQAIGLGVGGCKLCPECAPEGKPCRHPRKARPSPEGFGIDITELARGAGVPLEWPPKEYVHLLGLLLL